MYQVFISFRNLPTDLTIANELYAKLSELKINTYFSNDNNASNFSHEMHQALDEATIFISIGCTKESYNSEYVLAEIEGFNNEITSGRKKQGVMYGLFLEQFSINDAPYIMRQKENKYINNDGLNVIIQIIKDKLCHEEHTNTAFISDYEIQKTIIETTFENLSYYSDTNYVTRNKFDDFVNSFLVSTIKNALIISQKGVGTSTSLAHYARSFGKSSDVLFCRDINQLEEISNKILLNETAITSNLLIIVDDIQTIDDLTKFNEIINFKKINKIICGLTIDLIDNLSSVVSRNNKYLLFTMPYLDNIEIVNFIKAQKQYNSCNATESILQIINNSNDSFFQTPIVLDVLLKIFNDDPNKTYIDEIDLFEVYESAIYSDMTSLRTSIDKIVIEIFRSNINNVDINRLDLNYEIISELIYRNIIKRNGNMIAVKNCNYLHFKIASYLFGNFERKLGLQESKYNVEVEGFYSFMLAKEAGYENFDFEKVSHSARKIFIKLAQNSNDFYQVAQNNQFVPSIIEVVQDYIQKGYYSQANNIFQSLDEEIVNKNLGLVAEKYILNYYLCGKIDTVNLDDQNEMLIYYYAKLLYLNDRYKESSSYFEKALGFKDLSSDLLIDIKLDYLDLLLDCGCCGHMDTILKIIDECRCDKNISIRQLAKTYNIKAYLYLSQLKLNDSLVQYENSLKNYTKINDVNGIAKNKGNIAAVLVYQHKLDEAIEYIIENLTICEANHNENGVCITNEMLGEINLLSGEYISAYKYFERALYYAKSTQNRWREYRIMIYMEIISPNSFDLQFLYKSIENFYSEEYKPHSFLILSLAYLRNQKQKECLDMINKSYELSSNSNEKAIQILIKEIHDLLLNTSEKSILPIFEYIKCWKNVVYDIQNNIIDNKCKHLHRFTEVKISQNLTLKRLTVGATEDIFAYASRENCTRYLCWETHKSSYDTLSYIKLALNNELTNNYFVWAINYQSEDDNASQKTIGTIDLSWNSEYNCFEIGYIISDIFWGQGVGTNVVQAILNLCKSELKIDKLVGICFKDNIASIKILTNLGFVVNNEQSTKIKDGQKIVEKVLFYNF